MVTTKENIVSGLAFGLAFVEYSSAPLRQRALVDELIAEGRAYGYWAFRDQEGSIMIRKVRATGGIGRRKPTDRQLELVRSSNDLKGDWIWERPVSSYSFLIILLAYGLDSFLIGWMMKKAALTKHQFPKPLTPSCLLELAINASTWRKYHRFWSGWRKKTAYSMIDRAIEHINDPTRPVRRFDNLYQTLAKHGLAPLPTMEGEPHWSIYIK